ncbi:helix-turn-helix transcriptional regulator [Paenibacillus antarcticus]|uniref:AraC family transcriptional regulator n=1 Tax=Paenibacillus antarcticus TaxID=253703 RepID=A0A168J943_9BACL|nr:helix-turn-helix transcriptional regulator [Paenibacillus antarcticus]OAB40312.1 AraC family transcriptional regulator [Paenibacillus antarcticus]
MKEDHISATVQAIDYMKCHLDEDITSEQLAIHVNYSPFHFTRIFKSVTGISPRRYLSALRMESGKKELLKSPSLLVKVLLAIGFRSVGTFNTKFKENVGVTPKKFRNLSEALSAYMSQYENQELLLSATNLNSTIQKICCHVEAPDSFSGMIFVGLFPRPIPDQRPIAGTALNRKNRTCTFTNVPEGTYYALIAGIPWSLNPKDYFLLEHCLRGMFPSAIHVMDTTNLDMTIQLRGPLPFDPPIVVNLPLLLFEQKKN